MATFSRNDPAYRSLAAIVAERTTPIVMWVGSGLSVSAGLPTWGGLKQRIRDTGLDKIGTFSEADRGSLKARFDAAVQEANPWTSFERMRAVIGTETFNQAVRDATSPAATVQVPEAYQLLWQLPIRGVLTLNIDRLSLRGFSAESQGKGSLNEFSGRDMARLRHLLFSGSPFVGNLHGHFEDQSSWVFTSSEISKLLRHAPYTEFVRTVLSTCVNVFLGMSVDDIAVGGQLDRLATQGVQGQQRFWFSNRNDVTIDKWAESRGTRIIRYAPTPSHEAAIAEFLTSLRDAAPTRDATPAPISPAISQVVAGQVDQEDFGGLGVPELRLALNRRAAELLRETNADAASDYAEFCEKYEEEIHRAWFVSTREGRNYLLGYKLTERVARGAFGQVYRGIGPDGEDVAIKLLQQEVHDDPDLLRSFRQGVASMKILADYNIPNMVTYKAANEIPAFVVMDWVEGPNLAQLRDAMQVDNWELLLRVGHDLAEVIRTAHSLPERVLHRDIRPANVMLRDYWSGDWELVVLDFDLSWHRGIEQKSVYFSSAIGYLAPEQIEPSSQSTRNALVDSFGIGMTLYFMVGGRDPLPEQHRHRDFAEDVAIACSEFDGNVAWRSLPKRFASLLIHATEDSQGDRADVSYIVAELATLQACASGDISDIPVEHLAQEVIERLPDIPSYELGDVGFHYSSPAGVTYTLRGDEQSNCVELSVDWVRSGMEKRAGLAKYVQQGARTALDGLVAGGWEVLRRDWGGQDLHLRVSMDRGRIARDIDQVVQRLDRSLNALTFGGPG